MVFNIKTNKTHNLKHLTDEELMHSVSKGNLDCMALIFDRYHVRVYNFYYQMLRDKAQCEDLTQEVFIKIMKYKQSYQGGKFVSWIFKIARNIFSDHYRRQKTHMDFESLEYAGNEIEDSTIEKEEEIKHLMQIIEGLNKKDKELIVMNRLQGIKYDQIAEIIGSNSIAVKTRVHRIIKKMRTSYFETLTS